MLKILRGALFVLFAFALYSLVHFWLYRPDYVFGTEVAGWRYGTAGRFVGLSVLEAALSLAGIAVTTLAIKRKT
jgi:hypothetical protein